MLIWIPGPGLLLMVGIVLAVIGLRMRRQRTRAIVDALALIVSQNLPLGHGLRAVAGGERRKLRRMLEQIAHRVELGDPVSAAVRSAHWTCPGQIVGALQAGEAGGNLPTIIQSLAADCEDARNSSLSPTTTHAVGYGLVLALFVPAVVLAVTIVLIPRLRAIFNDFGLPLPAVTESVVAIGAAAAANVWLVAVAAGVLLLLVLQLAIGRHFTPRVPDRVQPLFVLVDTLTWHLPGLRRIVETRALARQLPVLHAALAAGQDLPFAAFQAACVDANWYARRRLRTWARAIDSGTDPLTAARTCGFPRPVRSALTAAAGTGRLPAVIDYLASYYRSLLVHWERVFASLLLPLTVLAWALLIGFIVVAFYLPLSALLDGVIGSVY
jgi:type II secretory pathway component PulF